MQIKTGHIVQVDDDCNWYNKKMVEVLQVWDKSVYVKLMNGNARFSLAKIHCKYLEWQE